MRFVLKNGRIFGGEGFFEGDIEVTDGIITAVGKELKSDGQAIDAFGCTVSKGLIDIHSHFEEIGDERFGFPADFASIPFGVCYAVDACVRRYANPDALKPVHIKTAVYVPLYFKGTEINIDAVREVIGRFGDKAQGVKVYFDRTINPDIELRHLKEAVELSRELGLRVMVHSSYSPTPMADIASVLGRGDILTHAYHGGENGIEDNDYLAYKIAKERGVIIDAGMAGGVHTDFAVLKRAIKAGYIPDTISSDITKLSAYLRGGVYGLTFCMTLMKAVGMDEKEIFRAVTVNAARAVGEADWAIRVGERADLAVLAYQATPVDITDKANNRITDGYGYSCKMTVVGGRILYRN